MGGTSQHPASFVSPSQYQSGDIPAPKQQVMGNASEEPAAV